MSHVYKHSPAYIAKTLEKFSPEDRPPHRLAMDISALLTGPTSGSNADRLATCMVGTDGSRDPSAAHEVAVAMRDAAERYLKTEKKMSAGGSNPYYVVKVGSLGMLELRQTRFRGSATKRPKDVMAVARDIKQLRETVSALGPDAKRAVDEYAKTSAR